MVNFIIKVVHKVDGNRYNYVVKKIGEKLLVRFRSYNTHQTFMTVVDPDIILKENVLLRVIEEFIEEHVFLDVFERKYKNDGSGAPGVHQKLMLQGT